MESTSRDSARVMHELILAALKRQDATLNQLATDTLVAIGRGIVHSLVVEVFVAKQVGYRLRLLHAIERIGEIPDPAGLLELFTLAQHRNARIRDAAVRVLCAMGPNGSGGLAQAAEVAAMPTASAAASRFIAPDVKRVLRRRAVTLGPENSYCGVARSESKKIRQKIEAMWS